MRTRRLSLILLLASAAAAQGCRSFDGEASITGNVVISDCDGDPRTLTELVVDTFYGSRLTDPALMGEIIGGKVHRLNLRMQRGSDLFYLTDALTIQILDVEKVKAMGMGPIEVGPDKLVRAQLELYFECPASESVGTARGTLTWTRPLSDQYGDYVGGSFQFTLDDGRGLDTFTGQVGGTFDFRLQRGQPGQRFP